MMVDEEFEGMSRLIVEHSFSDGTDEVFTKRGQIIIRSMSNNIAHFAQLDPLTSEEKDALRVSCTMLMCLMDFQL